MISGAFCTIITKNYAHYAVRLFQSLCEHAVGTSPKLYVFLVDEISESEVHLLQDFAGPGFEVVLPQALLSQSKMAQDTFATYAAQKGGMLRWALKPVAMKYVLEAKGADAVYFLDPDLCFFSDYQFLWGHFEGSEIVLSPHWRALHIDLTDSKALVSFKLSFKHGIYNAGFIGAKKNATAFLDWWNHSCTGLTDLDDTSYLYDDQKFLDIVPAYFKGVHILQHRGCNVSEWNSYTITREKTPDNQIILDQKYPLVFAHFARSYEEALGAGRDLIMGKLYSEYMAEIAVLKHQLTDMGLDSLFENQPLIGKVKKSNPLVPVKKIIYQQAKKIVDRAEGKN